MTELDEELRTQTSWYAMPKGFPNTHAASDLRSEIGQERAFEIYGRHAYMYNLASMGGRPSRFTTSLRSFCERAFAGVPGENSEQYAAWYQHESSVWAAMVRADVVRVDMEALLQGGKVEVLVVDFEETNRPRVSMRPRTSTDTEKRAKDAERKRIKRQEEKDAMASMSAAVLGQSAESERPPVHNSTVQDITEQDITDKQPLSQTVPVRPVQISAATNDSVEVDIMAARLTLVGCDDLVDQLVSLLAESNKTGKVRASKAYRQIWLPLSAAAESLTTEQLRYGLSAAIAKNAPNANYVKKAAEGYQPNAPQLSRVQPRLSDTTDERYDEIFGSAS